MSQDESTSFSCKKRDTKASSKSSAISEGKESLISKPGKSSIFERAQDLAASYDGECLSSQYSICKGKNAIKFRCQNAHTFYVSVDQIPESLENEAECC